MHSSLQEKSTSSGTPVFVVSLIGVAFIIVILLVISLTNLTNRETTLLGVVLTLLSIVVGWGISDYYAMQDKKAAIDEVREFEQRNLRTYALKAAEKVTNLSKELNRLSVYLEEELQYTGYRNSDEELFAKEERIESAIHILGSLRSINDTSLSDWQGVIGDELEEQRETEKEQTEALREIGERLSALEHMPASMSPAIDNSEIDEIKRHLRVLSAEISGTAFRSKSKPSFQQISTTCPNCSSVIRYGQRAKDNDRKAVQCKVCDANLISTYREATGFVLTVRGESLEAVICPSCSSEQSISLDNWPSASTTATCTSCNASLRISRADGGKTIKVTLPSNIKPQEPLTPEIIEKVRVSLPTQPWPKGIHQTIATALSLRPTTVQKAMQQLIRTGVFMDQLDGVICTTEEKIKIIREAGTRL
ncbi:hypothetical protein [Chromobacterium phragmitis]|uniref:MarR family transcriptional regulator n=1 Tax=Chromobacterium phragmitis TaxID=2202141 RepID=A0ABV0IX39_9NEIS